MVDWREAGGLVAASLIWTRGLAVSEPAEDFGEIRFLAVHEDADAVDAACEPENEDDGEDEIDR